MSLIEINVTIDELSFEPFNGIKNFSKLTAIYLQTVNKYQSVYFKKENNIRTENYSQCILILYNCVHRSLSVIS